MRSINRCIAAVLALSLVCGVLLLAPSAAYAKKQTVRFVVVGAAEGSAEVSAEMMALNMYLGALDYRMRTFHVLKGKYELKFISTLFDSANECLTGVATGAGEMTFSGPHFLEALEPGWKAVSAPGVFDDWDHFMRTMQTDAWKEMQEKMAKEKGVRIVKWIANIGDWYLYTKKGPVNSMADLSGQKIRFAGGEAFSNVLKQMGVTPISLPYTEVVTGLQTNMIDGLLTDYLGAVFFYNLPRYTPYAIDVTWAIQPINIVVNNTWWESLPEKERAAINDVFERIDTSHYFDGVIGSVKGGWSVNAWGARPATEVIRLSPTETGKWQDTMRKGSESVLKTIDAKLIAAIEASR